jgi:hypothetical protein
MKPLRDLRAELRTDLDDLRAKYLLRGPYGYLSAVLQKRRKWPKLVPSFESFVALLTDVTGKTFDGRVEKSGTRLFIEVSCSAGPQSKARYAHLINVCRVAKCDPEQVESLLRSRGGIRGAYT